jgi:hypothetical protein
MASCRATAKLSGERHVGWPVWPAGGQPWGNQTGGAVFTRLSGRGVREGRIGTSTCKKRSDLPGRPATAT